MQGKSRLISLLQLRGMGLLLATLVLALSNSGMAFSKATAKAKPKTKKSSKTSAPASVKASVKVLPTPTPIPDPWKLEIEFYSFETSSAPDLKADDKLQIIDAAWMPSGLLYSAASQPYVANGQQAKQAKPAFDIVYRRFRTPYRPAIERFTLSRPNGYAYKPRLSQDGTLIYFQSGWLGFECRGDSLKHYVFERFTQKTNLCNRAKAPL